MNAPVTASQAQPRDHSGADSASSNQGRGHMPTTTKAKQPVSAQEQHEAAQGRLDKATADCVAAQERLDGLRERQVRDGDVTAEEFGEAARILELADLDRQGAAANLAEAHQAARMEGFAELRADIDTRADPAIPAEAYEQAADAIANLIKVIGPERTNTVLEWVSQLRRLDVQPQPTHDRHPIAPEDDGFASYLEAGGGRVAAMSYTTSKGERRNIQAELNMGGIMASLVHRACHKAGVAQTVHQFEGGRAIDPLVSNPREWFKQHI